MKTLKLFISIALLAGGVHAQQSPIFNSYFLNSSLYNPSANGLGKNVEAFSMHKQYLTGFDANPTTTFLSIGAPLKMEKVGAGLNLYNDNSGVVNRFNVQGTYAYRIKLGVGHNLDFGVGLGFMQVSVDPDAMDLQNQNDVLLSNRNFSSGILDGNAGLTYSLKGLKIELAANNILGLKGSFSDLVNYETVRNYIATGSYRFYLGAGRKFSISPFIMARFAEIDTPQEGAIIFNYKDKIILAPGYKNNGALFGTAALKLFESLTVGYSYETGARNAGMTYQNGAHEVVLGYTFGNPAKDAATQKRIDDLDAKLEEYQKAQAMRDSIQDATLDQQQGQINENKEGVEEAKQTAEEAKQSAEQQKAEMQRLDEEIKKTQKELEELKEQLKKSGALREGSAGDFVGESTDAKETPVAKGYYVVLASVNKRNYNETAMQKEYLQKGYKKIFSEKTGWHYVYKKTAETLPEALDLLKEARKTETKKAWIFVLD